MIKYDINYYYNLLKIYAKTAAWVSGMRWDFILDNIDDEVLTVLDYGCGVGYMKAFAPSSVMVDTYDIMPVPQTGERSNTYDLVMLYDVLEHIPDFTELLPTLNKTKYVVLSVPIKPGNVKWSAYKHFKPGEHLHYFTHSLLVHIFSTMGFRLLKKGQPECPPREHVWSFIFIRKEEIYE